MLATAKEFDPEGLGEVDELSNEVYIRMRPFRQQLCFFFVAYSIPPVPSGESAVLRHQFISSPVHASDLDIADRVDSHKNTIYARSRVVKDGNQGLAS